MYNLTKKTLALSALTMATFAYAQTSQDPDEIGSGVDEVVAPLSQSETTAPMMDIDPVTSEWVETDQAQTSAADQDMIPDMDSESAQMDSETPMDETLEEEFEQDADMADEAPDDVMEDLSNIASLARKTDGFATLATAIEAAALGSVLEGAGPFTVFAPSDTAFSLLPDGKLGELLEPDSKEVLANLLTYHVVSGSLNAADLTEKIESNGGLYKLETFNGSSLKAVLAEDQIYLIDGAGKAAKVETADIKASNGVIHQINAVVIPK